MIRDIVEIADGKDLGLASSDIPRAANVISVQLGDLEYASSFGLDKEYFLTQQIQFQKANFRAYVVQRLAEHQIGVGQVIEFLEALGMKFTYQVVSPNKNVRGLIK